MSGRAATTDVIPGKYAIAVGIPDKPLPNGWNWHRLTDIAEMATGHTPSRSHLEYWDGPISWIGIKDARVFHGKRIDSTFQTVTQAGIDNSASVLLPANTVCLSRTASVGYVTIMNRPMATSQDFVNWVCSPTLVPEFLLYLLIAERDSLLKFGKGTTHTTIYFPEAKALAVAVPPIAEQKLIVEKIEELFSDLDAGMAALERVRAKLRRYRASVLNAAVTGKLTEAWRKQNPAAEPADKLLARILDERQKQWEAEQLRKFAEAGKSPPKGWRETHHAVEETESARPATLPISWCWTSIGKCFEVKVGATPSRAEPRYWGGDVLWASSGEVQFCRIRDTKEKITVDGLKNSSTHINPAGSVLLGMIGEGRTRGQAAILDVPACNNQNCAAIWVSRPTAFSEFVYYWLSSQYEQTRSQGSGNNQPALNKRLVQRMPIPVPPLIEQGEIVAKVELLLSVVDAAAVEVERGLKRAGRLRQAILKRAFEGRLISQESGDEAVTIPAEIQMPIVGMNRRRERTPRIAKPPRRKHRKGIVFDRGAVMARVVRRLGGSPYFGRTEAMKTLYVGEAWLGIDLELEPVREKRGPLDTAIYKIESLAQKQQWFTTKKVGMMFRYTEGPNIGGRLLAAERVIGDKLAEFDRLLDEIGKLDTDRAELFATSFAVWNDLLLDQKTADSQAIIAGVHGWHPSKIEKFPADRIERCIKWMYEKGFVPTGRGPRSEVLLGDGEPDDELG